MPKSTVTTLRTVPLLSELPENRLQKLAPLAHWKIFEAGDVIVHQDDTSREVYFVIAGFLKIMRGGEFSPAPDPSLTMERRHRPRQEVMMALLGPGDMVGEVASLLNTGRSASVIALTPCEVICIPSEEFLSCLRNEAHFALAVARRLAQRVIDANRQVELMRGNVEGRIHALLRECRKIGLDSEKWLSNAEVARMVGATRVAVSRIASRIHRRDRRSGAQTGAGALET